MVGVLCTLLQKEKPLVRSDPGPTKYSFAAAKSRLKYEF